MADCQYMKVLVIVHGGNVENGSVVLKLKNFISTSLIRFFKLEMTNVKMV